MKKTILIISIVLILSLIFISFDITNFVSGEFTSNSNKDYIHSWTKGICNETHCQDYEIYCNGNKLINQTPITGAVMSIDKDWIDPRNETNRERVCE